MRTHTLLAARSCALAASLLLPAVTMAASATSSASSTIATTVPTQACLQARVALESTMLSHADEMAAKHKAEMQKRRDALSAIADIADDADRQEALKKFHDDMKGEKSKPPEPPADIKAAEEAMRTACAGMKKFGQSSRNHMPPLRAGDDGVGKGGRGMHKGR